MLCGINVNAINKYPYALLSSCMAERSSGRTRGYSVLRVQKNNLLTMDHLLHLVYTAIGRWTNYRTNAISPHLIACCSALTSCLSHRDRSAASLHFKLALQACTSTSYSPALTLLCKRTSIPFQYETRRGTHTCDHRQSYLGLPASI